MQNRIKLIIIGAGGFGREIETWLHVENILDDHELIGYLDDDPNALDDYPSDYKIIGKPLSYEFNKFNRVIMGIADPSIKEYLASKLEGKVEFYTFISKTALLGKFNSIGKGSVICPGVKISTNIKIGNFVTLNLGAQIGHDVEIKQYSSLMPHVDIGGKCIIGKKVFIGTNATIIPSKVINDSSKIGAGSMVIRNVPENAVVVGNPSTRIK